MFLNVKYFKIRNRNKMLININNFRLYKIIIKRNKKYLARNNI